MSNELYGLQIRLKALRRRRNEAAASLNITEAERINADVLRVKAMIAERQAAKEVA